MSGRRGGATVKPYDNRRQRIAFRSPQFDAMRVRGDSYFAPAPITITPVRVADLLAEGERMPVYAHVIDHPDARVLVGTCLTELYFAVADMDPRLRLLS